MEMVWFINKYGDDNVQVMNKSDEQESPLWGVYVKSVALDEVDKDMPPLVDNDVEFDC